MPDEIKFRLLCCNMLNHSKCNYGNRCLFAHNVDEQRVDNNRMIVYDIIKSKEPLDNIDLSRDDNLYRTMVIFTRVCRNCTLGLCAGGMNCKHGVMEKKYRLCYKDITYGDCSSVHCDAIHLTIRGLIPRNSKERRIDTTSTSHVISVPRVILTNDYFNGSDSSDDIDDIDDLDIGINDILKIIDDSSDESDIESESIFGNLLTTIDE